MFGIDDLPYPKFCINISYSGGKNLDLGVSAVKSNWDQDVLLQTVTNFKTVERFLFKLSRSIIEIESMSRIKTLGH